MKRVDFWLTKEQYEQLKALPGNVSENIRQAIFEYLRLKVGFNARTSASERK